MSDVFYIEKIYFKILMLADIMRCENVPYHLALPQ